MLSIDGIAIGDPLSSILSKGWSSVGEELRLQVEEQGWDSLGEYYARKIRREGWSVADSLYHLEWYDAEGLFFHSSGLTIVNDTVVEVSGRRLECNGDVLYQAGDSWLVPFIAFEIETGDFSPESAPFECQFEDVYLQTIFRHELVQLTTLRALESD